MVVHRANVEWPTWVKGAREIFNITSDANVCVPQLIAAHFIHDKLPESFRRHADRALEQFTQKARKLNKPSHLTLLCTIPDFQEIEKSGAIDLWFYNLTMNHIQKMKLN